MLAVAALVGALLGRFALAGRDDGPTSTATRASGPGTSTASRVSRLQAQLRAAPDEPALLLELGVAYLARARETADPTFYAKAAEAVGRSQKLAPGHADTMTALGLVDLARHNFSSALQWGQRAHTANPASADALGVVTDALVELGRYDEAAATVQDMVDLRPALPSYARVSYVRELHGDVAGALTAMRQASAAGAGSAFDVAYVQTLTGDLYLSQGRLAQAKEAYQRALDGDQGYGPAEVGLARVAAAGGDLAGAVRRLEPVATRLPLPDSVALLGDLYAALGRQPDAARQYDLVRAIEALNRSNGISVDLELARFEADHARDAGADAGRAVTLARQALAGRPTVFADDILGWALRQAGRPQEALAHARRAVHLGTRDALLWFHLSAIEADLGQKDAAALHLRKAFAANPYLTARALPEARQLAARLGVTGR